MVGINLNSVHAFNRFEEEDHVESYKCHFRIKMMWTSHSLKSKDVLSVRFSMMTKANRRTISKKSIN